MVSCGISCNALGEKQRGPAPISGNILSVQPHASRGFLVPIPWFHAGHSGAWLLYLVSQHPEVEARICAELDEHGLLVTPSRPNPRKVTYEDLSKLTYLDMVIKVSLT